jgi:hypothetical protein
VVCLGRFSLSASVAICPVRHNQSCAGGGIVTSPTESAKSLRPAYCQAVATAVRHVSNFASETYYGTNDARPNIIIMGRVGIGFGGR